MDPLRRGAGSSVLAVARLGGSGRGEGGHCAPALVQRPVGGHSRKATWQSVQPLLRHSKSFVPSAKAPKYSRPLTSHWNKKKNRWKFSQVSCFFGLRSGGKLTGLTLPNACCLVSVGGAVASRVVSILQMQSRDQGSVLSATTSCVPSSPSVGARSKAHGRTCGRHCAWRRPGRTLRRPRRKYG